MTEDEWKVEYSDEVRGWLDSLNVADLAVADRAIDKLRKQGNKLRMPRSRFLGDGLFELRFDLNKTARRITYVWDTTRQAFTLTTFRKQKQNERREILRARRAKEAHEKNKKAGESK